MKKKTMHEEYGDGSKHWVCIYKAKIHIFFMEDKNIKSMLESYLKMLEYAIGNSNVRTKIIILLFDKPLTISALQKVLEQRGEKYNYRTIWQHVVSLNKMGVINLHKEEHQSGKPVVASLSKDFPKDEILKQDFKDIMFLRDFNKTIKEFNKTK